MPKYLRQRGRCRGLRMAEQAQQLTMQLGYSDPNLARGVRPGQPPMPYPAGQPMAPQQPEQVLILK